MSLRGYSFDECVPSRLDCHSRNFKVGFGLEIFPMVTSATTDRVDD